MKSHPQPSWARSATLILWCEVAGWSKKAKQGWAKRMPHVENVCARWGQCFRHSGLWATFKMGQHVPKTRAQWVFCVVKISEISRALAGVILHSIFFCDFWQSKYLAKYPSLETSDKTSTDGLVHWALPPTLGEWTFAVIKTRSTLYDFTHCIKAFRERVLAEVPRHKLRVLFQSQQNKIYFHIISTCALSTNEWSQEQRQRARGGYNEGQQRDTKTTKSQN